MAARKESKSDAVLPSFEAGIEELDKLIQLLESGRLPLNEALESYQRGAKVLQSCQQLLQVAENQMKILEGDVLQSFSLNSIADENSSLKESVKVSLRNA